MNRSEKVRILVLGAVLTAMVVILQIIAGYTKLFGVFSGAVALIPIAIGAITCGPYVGAWLGFVFGAVVLVCPETQFFLGFDFWGTIVTVLAKGTLAGLVAGFVYKLVKKWNKDVAAITTAFVCPIVNTGVFLAGCALFFMDSVVEIAAALTSRETGFWVFIAMVSANFLFEVGISTVISPFIVRLIKVKNLISKE